MNIVGLKSFDDFQNYGIKCGDYHVVALVYEDCYIGQISLPLMNIILSYPNLRIIYWRCKGYCVHPDTGITVVGCNSGKRYSRFQTSVQLYPLQHAQLTDSTYILIYILIVRISVECHDNHTRGLLKFPIPN